MEIIIGKYKFRLIPTESKSNVKSMIETTDGKSTTEEDIKTLKELVKDWGKWELMIDVGSSVLEGLEITKKRDPITRLYGFIDYVFSQDDKKDNVWWIKPRESGEPLSLTEVYEQLKNLAKWRKFEKALENLKQQLQ